jgi:hypothetical protein
MLYRGVFWFLFFRGRKKRKEFYAEQRNTSVLVPLCAKWEGGGGEGGGSEEEEEEKYIYIYIFIIFGFLIPRAPPRTTIGAQFWEELRGPPKKGEKKKKKRKKGKKKKEKRKEEERKKK